MYQNYQTLAQHIPENNPTVTEAEEMTRWYDRAVEELEKQLDNDLITREEFNREMRELNAELREAAREAANDAYNDYIGY